ncbi:hypothetical protein Q3G72_022453 [Acer saccharum]|nr:hypothetical protein Q3G72_022453 [Acer saccharum]
MTGDREIVLSQLRKLTLPELASLVNFCPAPQMNKEDIEMERSPLETIKEIECWDSEDIRKQLPPYIKSTSSQSIYGW